MRRPRLGILLPYVLVVAMGVLGFWRLEVANHRSCEFGNEFRAETLPKAFAIHSRNLGRELGATDAQIQGFIAKDDRDFAELFPERAC